MTMSYSERLAVAAHLHVLLRRRTGRVTDPEWMAENNEYAAAMVRFARQRAQDDGAPDLAEWADRLERAMLHAGDGADARAALVPGLLGRAPRGAAQASTAGGDDDRYVGRLR